jgi:hypothetical protein
MTMTRRLLAVTLLAVAFMASTATALNAQGVTTGAMSGIVTDTLGTPLPQAVVVAVHVPSNTRYQTVVRSGGVYNLPNMRVGGPYTVTAQLIGYAQQEEQNIFVSLGQDLRLDFLLTPQAIRLTAIEVTAEENEILNADRSGAATFITPDQVELLPSVKRSIRDLIRTDPRNDGNYAFGGRNWLYNNISLDGSYFNNSFGLDDPAPGGQTNAEPVPYDAVEQVQVSIAPHVLPQPGVPGQ